MQRSRLTSLILACASAALAAGCGKPTLPGSQIQGERAVTPGLVATDTPLPEKPFREWGAKNAKVQLLALFPIDEPHKKVIELVQEVAEKHPGRVYARYVDYRTPEGAQLFQQNKATVACIMINGETAVELPSDYGPHTVDFVKEIGRYWTADDLRAAVALKVREAYGAAAAPAK